MDETSHVASLGSFGEPFGAYLVHDQQYCEWCHRSLDGGQRCGLPERNRVRELLQQVYGDEIVWGRCERGDSLVLRSELFLSGHTQSRGAHRCHFAQRSGASASGQPIGRYLGFAEIRPGAGEQGAPIAAAFLKLPMRFVRSQVHQFPMAWYYGSYSGVMPFMATPYTMHNAAHGYLCAQACVYLSLLMMARRGGKVFGPTTITAIARPRWGAKEKAPHVGRGYHAIPSSRSEDFDVHGLNAVQIERVGEEAGLSAHREWLPRTDPDYKQPLAAQRLIGAYVASGCPVIPLVSIRKLHQREREAQRLRGATPPSYGGDEHAVVIVG